MHLSKNEIIDYLKSDLSSDSEELFKLADRIRKENVNDVVHLRGLIEFSNFCSKNCLYCGIRSGNKDAKRYRLSKDEILGYVENALRLGLKTIVLQSGEDSYYDSEKMTDIISSVKKYDVALTLSIGEKSFDTYKAYKDAGADRFLIRIETTDKELYKKMHPPVGELASYTEPGPRIGHPDCSYEKRKESLRHLKSLGFETGTGNLVGLPGQTVESLADDILFFKEIGADMVGIGPFIPNNQTPLKDSERGSFELALKVMALTRLVLPKANIPATTAMETIHPNGRILALQSGANVVMPNMTDYEINKNYELYQNKASNAQGVKETLDDIRAKISSIGRIPL